ncbi:MULTISPECIES: DUF1501 domain-containing protein [Sphingobacterium]|jgi:hypothetical protein|uniref:DUF1501 domain-containing protein n=2 Tax=Sphingobacterium TaxID=28453 RepID=A0ABW5YSP2_9SPHI|nr:MULTISPECIES: DUF1501 domain-containing protein [Sphingobacterium]MBB2949838.1 hypothetical protein [Sphingobacterium sp. JUb56]MCS3554470.1 hypothetical protein [Sphingobacterium sp. JUb21]MCW2263709.1 hypothetical protein [Sphingobacterium kitahiroshimense]NJI73521.1 DUF1501 domain-containing protein [Sphingobacterium sp. B16(2022)]QQD13240.1 DUF1501 domain-containing protein [Sphingobacterium sp. UDSM-2020]
MKDLDKLFRELQQQKLQAVTRRHFLKDCVAGVGSIALASFLASCGGNSSGSGAIDLNALNPLVPKSPHFPGKAKSVIYLHMAGAPSQLELFDYKPVLQTLHNQPCPESLLAGKTFAFIRGTPKMLGPQATFKQYGQSGAWVSDHLPHFSKVVDDVSFLKAVHTDQFNHGPAQMFMQTGSARLGRPSIGSWVTYGLGSENSNLPGFVVLTSGGKTPDAGKSVWGSGFLPSVYQGVQCRSKGDPVLYLADPEGMSRDLKRHAIDAINEVNKDEYNTYKDPETLSRIAQYEMAYKMQVAVPEVMDISQEPAHIHELYGTEPGKESFANNCLLARKLVEQGVRYVQLFDWGWDSHGTNASDSIDYGFRNKCREIDRPMTALIMDLKQRGLLDETLVVWGGEFGRTPMQENRDNSDMPFLGRDHHTDAYTIWMAGGGVKKGVTYGETDEIGFTGVSGRSSVHDVHATMLHLLGFDHEKFTYEFQGRPFRLTDVEGNLISAVV